MFVYMCLIEKLRSVRKTVSGFCSDTQRTQLKEQQIVNLLFEANNNAHGFVKH